MDTVVTRTSTKLSIPHPEEKDATIVGVLERVATSEVTEGRKIALILHGTMGHKDYLFQKRLALRLPIDSFRFDFRGSHESTGTWKYGGFAEDVQDLVAVVAYLKNDFGYEIDLLVGHSRGSVVAFRWLCTAEEAKTCRGLVNVSGRYRMHRIYDGAKSWKAEFDSQGYHEWNVTVARKPVVARITPQDLEEFSRWDSSAVWHHFPQTVDVLTLHGLADKTVPPYDAFIYARALSNRAPGTHNICVVEDADHNFTGMQDDVVDTILEWWTLQQRGALKTGVWMTGVKGKL